MNSKSNDRYQTTDHAFHYEGKTHQMRSVCFRGGDIAWIRRDVDELFANPWRNGIEIPGYMEVLFSEESLSICTVDQVKGARAKTLDREDVDLLDALIEFMETETEELRSRYSPTRSEGQTPRQKEKKGNKRAAKMDPRMKSTKLTKLHKTFIKERVLQRKSVASMYVNLCINNNNKKRHLIT
jgi:hypothetical protein